MTQRYRLLHALRSAGETGLSSWDAVNGLKMLRAGARIQELRKEGYDIETVRDPNGPDGQARFRYVLHAEPEDSETRDVPSWGEAQSRGEKTTGAVTGVSPHEDTLPALFDVPAKRGSRSAITGRELSA